MQASQCAASVGGLLWFSGEEAALAESLRLRIREI